MEDCEKAITGLKDNRTKANADLVQFKQDLQELEQLQTSIIPTISKINEMLVSSGFDGFKLDAENDTTYKLVRSDGTTLVGRTLSEGEKKFVAFLYFWRLITGSDSATGISDDRIIVIDDPVSSLDSGALFVVSTLIRRLIQQILTTSGNVKQVILLTHNLYFYKEVTYFYGKRDRQASRKTYWEICKKGNVSTINKRMSNSIQTAYEQLWSEVCKSDLSVISLQNVMRRILEYYFKILGKTNFDELEQNATFSEEEQICCKALISWINDGSHSFGDGIDYTTTGIECEQFRNIFKKIFEATGHKCHYDMMVEKCTADSEL